MNLKRLSDKNLIANTNRLAKAERAVTLKILHHLAEIQRRRLFSALGHSSLFAYCTAALSYSEGAAQRRIQAMRVLVEMPELEAKIESGALSLMNLASAQAKFYQCKKAGHPLPIGKKKEILRSLEGKSKRAADRDLEIRFSQLPKKSALARSATANLSFAELCAADARTAQLTSCIPEDRTAEGVAGPTQGCTGLPLVHSTLPVANSDVGEGEGTFQLLSPPPVAVDETKRVMVSAGILKKLKGLLAHKSNGISDEELVEMALNALVRELDPALHVRRKKPSRISQEPKLAKSNHALTPESNSPAIAEMASGKEGLHPPKLKKRIATRTIPIGIKREVWKIANSQCEHCGSLYALQVDHVKPRYLGGSNDPKNLRLLCRNCNQRQAVEKLGNTIMAEYLAPPS